MNKLPSSHSGSFPTLVVSLDFEIGWGDVTNEIWKQREKAGIYRNLRKVLPEILKEMDLCDFPISWASVGAMFDNPTRRDFSYLPDVARKIVETSVAQGHQETFDGCDLFKMVLAADAHHEIICHSYSHVPFNFDGMNEQIVAEDLSRFGAALSQHGLNTSSLVFPENTVKYIKVVAESGYTLVRTPAPRRYKSRPAYWITTQILPPPMSKNKINSHGVVEQSGSMLFNARALDLMVPLIARQTALGTREMLRSGSIFHVWSHPFNFAESAALAKAFVAFIHDMARLRDAGKLEIKTFSNSIA